MKKRFLILLILLLPLVYAQNYEIKGYVNDYADILTSAQESEISAILKQIHESGIAEYAIVIIDTLEGQPIDDYAYNLAEGKLGDTERNNGILLLIAVTDREYDFEVGRGLEPVIPDIIAGRIGRNYLTPNFREENYAKGIKEASLAVRDVLLENTESEYYVQTTTQSNDITNFYPFFIILIFILVWILPIIFALGRSKKEYKKKHRRRDSDLFMAAWIIGNMMKGGGGRGGFGGGGFGGFGGGSFGGGGASGGW